MRVLRAQTFQRWTVCHADSLRLAAGRSTSSRNRLSLSVQLTNSAAGLSMVRVFRGGFRGPVLEPVGAGAIGDPTRVILEGKFRKVYPTTLPIELVAYYDLQIQCPLAEWKPEVSRFVSDNLPSSPFRRVWIFSHISREVLYVHPPLGGK